MKSEMREKVCMVIPSFSAKGGITAVANGYRDSKLEKDYDVKYIETYCDAGKIEKLLVFAKALISFIIILLSWHPDIVHIHSSFGGSFYRKKIFIDLAHLMRISIVNHIHGSYYDEFFFSASTLKKRIIKRTYNKCSRFVALSENAKEQLSKIVSEEKITVIENFAVLNQEAISARQHKGNDYKVLFLGFVTEKKGCYDIPDIFRIVSQKLPNIRFIIAGVGDVDRIKELIGKDWKDNFDFPGWVTGAEKDRLLKESDLFFLPSYSEGMPMSILDAMGYGLPIISTTVGGVTKIVHEGENGFVFEPGDKAGMAEAIVKILTDSELMRKMGKNSVSIIKRGYSLEKHIENLEEVYQCVCGRVVI